VFTFSLNESLNLSTSEISALYTKSTPPSGISGAVIAPDRTGDPDRVLITYEAESTFNPFLYGNIVAWYDAADENTVSETGGIIDQWDDKSGNNNDLSQGFAGFKPTYLSGQTLTNKNVIEFDSNDQLTSPIVSGMNIPLSAVTVFMVSKTDISGAIRLTTDFSTIDNTFDIQNTGTAINDDNVYFIYGDTTSGSINIDFSDSGGTYDLDIWTYRSGVSEGQDIWKQDQIISTDTTQGDDYNISGRNFLLRGYNTSAQVGELLIFNERLDDGRVKNIISKLQTKWFNEISRNSVHLYEKVDGTWTEKFKRESQLSGFGTDIDLSGDLILIGAPNFRSNTGKIESWYMDSIISGYTANTDYQGWAKVVNTNEDNYWGQYNNSLFGNQVALSGNNVYAHADGINITYKYNIDYKGNLKLQRAVTSNKAQLIETNDNVKVLGIDNNTKYRIKDTIRNIWLGCIYASEDFRQENATANPDVNSAYETDVEMLGAEGPIEQIVQLDNAGLGFKTNSLNATRYYNFDKDTYSELPENVVVYNPCDYTSGWWNELSGLPRAILSGVHFAHMSEIPVDLVYYNFDTGDMYMDEFPLQGFADYKYDVNSVINDSTSAIYNAVQLSGTRVYDRIGTNGNIIWTSYDLGTNYGNSETVNNPIPEGSGTVVNMEIVETLSGGIWDYQFIERIKGVARAGLGAEHKSNVYSIEIKNSQLNESIVDEEQRLLVQRIVERAVREFAKKVAPANTQLWKIIWTGK